jgi:uncharacterized protein YndB with AHSA1/START domain
MTKGATRAMALAAAAALALAGAGCGNDDDDTDEPNDGGGATAQPSRLAIELSGPGQNPTFDLPKSVEGGVVEIEFTSSVEGEHGAQLVRIEGDHTAEEALAAADRWAGRGKGLPGWLFIAGGTPDVARGGSASVTQVLEPGRYLVADVNTGASAELEVTRGPAGGELPAAEGTIIATEYAFETDGLEAGHSTVMFDNAGEEPHLVVASALRPGKTAADARRFFETEEGPPPVDDSRTFSTAVVEGGVRQAVELDLEAGRYVLICFVPDRPGGPPHVAKGMISEATVAE